MEITISGRRLRVGLGQPRPKHVGTLDVATVRKALADYPALRVYGLTMVSTGQVDTFDTTTGRYWIGSR